MRGIRYCSSSSSSSSDSTIEVIIPRLPNPRTHTATGRPLPGSPPLSIFYPIRMVVAGEYRQGQWFANVFPTRILNITPFSQDHGTCNVRYRHEGYSNLPYRSHGVDPNTLDWGNLRHFLEDNDFAHTGDQVEWREGIDVWDPANQHHSHGNNDDHSSNNSSSNI